MRSFMAMVLAGVSTGMLLAGSAAAVETGEIIVTALPVPKGDVAYDKVSIPRARLTGSASGRIEDVLRDVGGFQQFRRTDSRTANPTSQGATLRALGGNASSRALVLLDGAPVADPFAGYIPWFALAPERLGAAIVTRGAGAGAFGTGALAGTIELQSADPAALPAMQADVAYGSRNSVSLGGVGSARLGEGSISLFGRFDGGDGYVIVPEGQRGPADVAARYKQGSIGLHSVVQVNETTRLMVNALAFDDRRVRGVEGNSAEVKGASSSLRLVGDGRWQWEALGYVQAMAFTNTVVALDAARAVATPSLDQFNTPATGFGGKIEVRPPVGDALQLRLGIDLHDETGQTRERSRYLLGRFTRLREAGGHNQVVGGYAEASFAPAATLTLTAGGRLDHWRIADGALVEHDAQTNATTIDIHPADRSKWEGTGRGGIAWAPSPVLGLRGAGYLGYRLPTLNELYRPFRVGADATAANTGLVPERLRGIEAGIDLHPLPGVNLGLTAFVNRLDNAIANVTVALGPGVFPQVGFVAAGAAYRQRRNLDAIVARGIEAEAHVARGAWRFDASYAYTRSRVRASGAALALDGLTPAQTPTHQASATLGWTPATDALLAVTGRYTSGQFEDDLASRRLNDALTLDAVAVIPLAHGVALTLRAENITDTLVEAGISTSGVIDRGTPRTIWAGFRIVR